MAPGSPSRELVAASSKPLVLAVLARGENYGYAILKEVERLSGGALSWQEGMLYPVLQRLERDGLIQSQWHPSNGRRRKYYSLTPRGRQVLEEERSAWIAVDATVRKAWGGI